LALNFLVEIGNESVNFSGLASSGSGLKFK